MSNIAAMAKTNYMYIRWDEDDVRFALTLSWSLIVLDHSNNRDVALLGHIILIPKTTNICYYP
jgi:hypothetical protein